MASRRTVVFSTLVAALGGLLFGFDTAVISGTTDALERVFELDAFGLGFTVAAALIGTIVGALAAGPPADRLGRNRLMMLLAVFYLVSAIGTAVSGSWIAFVLYRFLGGLAVGGSSVVSPMYIAEISPARLRGRLVAVAQLNVVIGILLAFFSNYLVAQLASAERAWRWMLGVEAFPAALFLVLLFFIPLSPRWLVKRGRTAEARHVLERLGEEDVERELQEIVASLPADRTAKGEPLLQRRFRKPIFLAWAVAMFNQLSGINALMYYAPRIFQMAGAAASDALLQAVAVGGTNLIFTIAAMTVIDRFGRRPLLLIGSVGTAASLGVVSAAFFGSGEMGPTVLVGLLGFIAFFAMSQGAVIWVFISEIFPNRVRSKGQSLGSFTHWFMAALVSWTFPVIAAHSPGHAFGLFSSMMVLQFFFAWKIMPETKGLSLEELEFKLGIGTDQLQQLEQQLHVEESKPAP
jgi:sugar porter (SP) family MFS transporter